MPADLPHASAPMQISEVRKCLNAVRRAWDNHSPRSSIKLASELPNQMTISDFASSSSSDTTLSAT